MNKIIINQNTAQDIINIANGAYFPLRGFLKERDFYSVLNTMRLTNGLAWTIPIILDINKSEFNQIKNESTIVLVDQEDKPQAVLKNIEVFPYDKKEYAAKVFNTTDEKHPGVKDITAKGEYLVGGEVYYLGDKRQKKGKYYNSPKDLKDIFKKKGWQKIVAFQTRNIPHRSHEFLQKHALGQVDGLLIQPVIGKKKIGDFKDELIIKGYTELIKKYYPKEKTVLSILPLKMHYAGPREAVHHALIRRNYGCTHIIIGRDHAGTGDYYHPYAAHKIFNQFDGNELGIDILKFNDVIYCAQCGELTFSENCGHASEQALSLSGSKIREMIKNKQQLPKELIRPEISKLLLNHPDPFV